MCEVHEEKLVHKILTENPFSHASLSTHSVLFPTALSMFRCQRLFDDQERTFLAVQKNIQVAEQKMWDTSCLISQHPPEFQPRKPVKTSRRIEGPSVEMWVVRVEGI